MKSQEVLVRHGVGVGSGNLKGKMVIKITIDINEPISPNEGDIWIVEDFGPKETIVAMSEPSTVNDIIWIDFQDTYIGIRAPTLFNKLDPDDEEGLFSYTLKLNKKPLYYEGIPLHKIWHNSELDLYGRYVSSKYFNNSQWETINAFHYVENEWRRFSADIMILQVMSSLNSTDDHYGLYTENGRGQIYGCIENDKLLFTGRTEYSGSVTGGKSFKITDLNTYETHQSGNILPYRSQPKFFPILNGNFAYVMMSNEYLGRFDVEDDKLISYNAMSGVIGGKLLLSINKELFYGLIRHSNNLYSHFQRFDAMRMYRIEANETGGVRFQTNHTSLNLVFLNKNKNIAYVIGSGSSESSPSYMHTIDLEGENPTLIKSITNENMHMFNVANQFDFEDCLYFTDYINRFQINKISNELSLIWAVNLEDIFTIDPNDPSYLKKDPAIAVTDDDRILILYGKQIIELHKYNGSVLNKLDFTEITNRYIYGGKHIIFNHNEYNSTYSNVVFANIYGGQT